ncbi:signal transduction histidine kinase [Hamadaea flava]|uniref:histidine kinase n=1 Tax=Hamadaea flava TaxID=1742688 RepID=A0ABV8LTY1_9ACTN|nr:sensor histidine kinase [Hamadaea flava]MCP2324386.1 signal transduction histidine kinase [Hamadaea flava]
MRTARSFAYLVTSLVAGPAGFVWTLATTLLMAVGAVTALGAPVFLAVTWLDRHLADLERRRAAWVLGAPITPPYLPVTATGRARVRQVAAQPATWRDMVWFAVLLPVGLTLGIIAVVTTVVTAAAVIAPAWAWSVPERRAHPLIQQAMGTHSGRLLISAVGIALIPIAMWLVRQLASAQARVAVALLAPGEHGRLVRRAQELAASRARVVDAQAAELRRIERDLHDGAQARIVAAGMTLALAERRARTLPAAPAPDGAGVLDGIATARRQLDEALAELRRLVRGIHPPILTDRGLAAAVSALAGDCPIPVAVTIETPERLSPAVESAAYFVVAEGLANAVKHAAATSCSVLARHVAASGREHLTVEVADDGTGGAEPAGSGLDGLRRRIEALDGTFIVTSPPGGPTRLRAEIPCAS